MGSPWERTVDESCYELAERIEDLERYVVFGIRAQELEPKSGGGIKGIRVVLLQGKRC